MSCMVEGEPKPEVTWSFRGKPLVDEGRVEIYQEKGTYFLEIFDLVGRDAGLYTCRIVNSAGRSSALVELVVNGEYIIPLLSVRKSKPSRQSLESIELYKWLNRSLSIYFARTT